MNLPRHVFGVCTLALAATLGGMGGAANAADRGVSVGHSAERADARSIYQTLGFDGPLREAPAAMRSPAALRAALTRLQRDTLAGDRVFVHVAGPALPRCELTTAAHALGQRAAQVVMLVDAPVAAACAAGPASPPADGRVVVLSAARRGASVTPALRRCLARPGLVTNPLASFGDLLDCAVAADPAGSPSLALAGNADLPLQPRLTALVDPSAHVAGESPLVALQRAAARADARWRVDVADVVGAVDAAGGAAAWHVTSERDGFLYLVRAAADGSGLNLVYPQRPGEANSLRAGQGFDVPRAGLSASLAAPDRLMVLVSDTSLRSGDLFTQLGLAHYAAAACLRNLGGDECPSTAAGPLPAAPPLHFGAVLLPVGTAP